MHCAFLHAAYIASDFTCVYCAAAGTISWTKDAYELGFSYLSISIFKQMPSPISCSIFSKQFIRHFHKLLWEKAIRKWMQSRLQREWKNFNISKLPYHKAWQFIKNIHNMKVLDIRYLYRKVLSGQILCYDFFGSYLISIKKLFSPSVQSWLNCSLAEIQLNLWQKLY